MGKKVSSEYLRRAALHYLNRYSASEDSLRRVLKRKVDKRAREADEDPHEFYELIEPVVTFCRDHKFVDDLQFAQSKIRSATLKGKSSSRIKLELNAKGVSGDDIQTAFDDENHDDQRAAIAYAKRRRLGPWRTKPKEERRDKELGSLIRAGFPFSLAQKIIDMTLEEAEDIIYGPVS
ncbi:Regulatory protein RecX [Pseudovibrio sp. W64]|uniref:regulatory protein RecX n=1 Tax=unclassified Pseudovibrio TaxID=2627060 RepID=UPI0007AEB8BC|nr:MULTISPECIES: regulatory protein RecX [unclassified Pseudovibrio]KZK78570.1 Regulatory protein RecX [Pseudovibrio sp. W64]